MEDKFDKNNDVEYRNYDQLYKRVLDLKMQELFEEPSTYEDDELD
jgi:hypothetical protein